MICLKQKLKRLLINYQISKKRKHFKLFGDNSLVYKPLRIDGASNISIYNDVRIGFKSWIAAMPLTDSKMCQLVFYDGATIGDFNHIYATESIIIEKNVLTANFVYISDNLHCFEDVNVPIVRQPIKQLKPVVIGEGCWIGEHVSIIGASVGKHSVIGANAVVTHDIPDYCVAIGIPAKVIKRYDPDSNTWKKTDTKGNFL